MSKKIYIMLLLLFCTSYFFAGLSPEMLVKTDKTYTELKEIDVHCSVACMRGDRTNTLSSITHKFSHRVQHYVTLHLDNDSIDTTLDQRFFLPLENIFKEAAYLKIGDVLLSYSGEHISIRDISTMEEEKEFFDISVHECHNFFVSRSEILVHNVAPLVIGLTWLFGEGAVQFVGASLGIAACGAAVGIKIHHDKNRENSFSFCNVHQEHGNYWYASEDAQAPGKPTEADGYVPPKKWDGKKVKNPNGTGYGYPDEKGHVWIPTGPGGLAHGGPHWDVQNPKTRGHRNVVPGGEEI